jgi:hypothetical protein
MISAAASLPSQTSSSSIVVMHIDTSDMTPILKEAFGKNVEIATISNNGSVPAKYFYEGLQNYIEGTVADHTEDGVTPNKNNIGIVLKEILNDNLRTALMPFDRDGDGTIDAEELQQAAKDHQTVLMSRKILAWFFVCAIALHGYRMWWSLCGDILHCVFHEGYLCQSFHRINDGEGTGREYRYKYRWYWYRTADSNPWTRGYYYKSGDDGWKDMLFLGFCCEHVCECCHRRDHVVGGN